MNSSKLSLTAFIVLLGFFFTSRSLAQDADTMAYKHIEAGIYVGAGASIFNGTVPDGSKTDIFFPAFGVGAMGIYSFHPFWGAVLGIGYDSRGMSFHNQGHTDQNENIALNYISIQPSIKFKQFLLGININIPASASVKLNPGSGLASITQSVGKDTLNSLLDIRIEGMLPITESETGALYVTINASYCISDAIGKGGFFTVGQTTSTPITKSPVPVGQIGLSYLFAPGGKTH